MTKEQLARGQHSIFFTKQPILNAKRSIWGYELLGAVMRGNLYEVFPQQESAAGLCSSTYQGLQEAMNRGKKIMIGFDDLSILAGIPQALPAAYGVVRVLPGFRMEGLAIALKGLRSEGYQTMIEAIPGQQLPAEICRQADIIGFDFSSGRPDLDDLDQMKRYPVQLLARGLKTLEQFQSTLAMGFSLFQGAFFKEPEVVRDRKLGSNEVARLNLFRLMEEEEVDIKDLAAAIRSDVSVSFRLLSFLNSASFGFRQNIQSIDQAIMLLGWLKLKSWLRAVLLVDMTGKDEVPQELAALSLQRGKFFELLATEYDYWGFNPSTLFLVGLFSLMDAILGMPMEKVVEMLPLEAKLKVALKRDGDSEYRPLFELLDYLEDADWVALEILTQKLCLDLGSVKEAFAASRNWADGFFASRS